MGNGIKHILEDLRKLLEDNKRLEKTPREQLEELGGLAVKLNKKKRIEIKRAARTGEDFCIARKVEEEKAFIAKVNSEIGH